MCGKPKVLYRLNMVVQECIRNPPTCQIFYQIAWKVVRQIYGHWRLNGGIQYIQNRGIDDINRQEIALTERFSDRIGNHGSYYNIRPRTWHATSSCGFHQCRKSLTTKNIGIFGRKAEIAERSGLHCSPLAHETLGTLGRGTVRFSFGYHNTEEEVDTALMF